ncbi:unnamed protein product [Bursaphelenchus okinawaensis]|uniref:Uncharacterized protein n=1 Tax=Bursaphelenchus okinawaensis TaxID=465554 RepID=A0A811LM72_9BILA|nr:unnamed protein product [Bursaphelenchus okinawaensis]CAG9124231.1 unnamed protein product [Bursaphelenchus okinawaensis]
MTVLCLKRRISILPEYVKQNPLNPQNYYDNQRETPGKLQKYGQESNEQNRNNPISYGQTNTGQHGGYLDSALNFGPQSDSFQSSPESYRHRVSLPNSLFSTTSQSVFDDVDVFSMSNPIDWIQNLHSVDGNVKKSLEFAANGRNRFDNQEKDEFNEFFRFIGRYHKVYPTQVDFKRRFKNFQKTYNHLRQNHDEVPHSGFGLSPLADISDDEFLRHFTGLKRHSTPGNVSIADESELMGIADLYEEYKANDGDGIDEDSEVVRRVKRSRVGQGDKPRNGNKNKVNNGRGKINQQPQKNPNHLKQHKHNHHKHKVQEVQNSTAMPHFQKRKHKQKKRKPNYLKLKNSDDKPKKPKDFKNRPYTPPKIPQSWDLREVGAVASVIHQQSCGACYAFAITAQVEGALAIKNGELTPLSQQDLISCSNTLEDNDKCDGGYLDSTLHYVKKNGQASAADVPYVSADGHVPQCSKVKRKAKISNYKMVLRNREDLMKRFLYFKGPLSVTVDARQLKYYTNGVLQPRKPKGGWVINHAVTIIGYGAENSTKYWIVKNSWGPTWGEDGYFRVIRGNDAIAISQECYVAYT